MKKLVQNLFVLLFLVIASDAIAQDRVVTGTVTAQEDGLPLPGVTVRVKGTTMATSTTAEGKFSITAAGASPVLQFSFIGYTTQEIPVPASNQMSVSMRPDAQQLGEVVVTAFGITRTRNQVPYAAQQVTGAEVSKTRNTNFVQNLSGKVAGLDIKQTNTLGGSTNVVMRGTKSITGNNQALFVVDGVAYSNNNNNTANQRTGRGGYDYGNAAADINPDDIESVTVLKGAAASALYGSQGANGVILVTTKKGSKGLGIVVNSGLTLSQIDKSTFPTYQKEFGAGYGRFYGPNEDAFFNELDVNGDGVADLVAPVHEDASYGAPFDPNQLVYQWDSFIPGSPNFQKARPWTAAANDPSEFFDSPLSSNNSIFLDGGTEKGTFKLGYTRNDDRGILPNSRVNKNLVNFGGSYNITPELTAGANINFTNIVGKGRFGTGYDDKNLMTNFRQWWQVNVDVLDQKTLYFNERENATWNMKAGDPYTVTPNFWDNPYFSRYENFENDTRNRYFGNANLSYKLTDWLNLSGRVSLDSYQQIQEERQAVGSVTTSQYNRFNQSFNESNYQLLANLDKDITADWNVKGLLGTALRHEHNESIRAATNGGIIVPRVYALSNSLNLPNPPVEFDGTREVHGIFAGATLSWKNMVTLDGTIRRDRSSTLPKGNNVYYYPSVSVGWTFSEMLPEATKNWLSYAKIRANYAEVGNDAPIFSVNDVYLSGLAPFGSNPQSSVTGTKNNPDLVPEQTQSSEVGLELSMFDSRLGLDFSYYDAKTVDQIVPVILSTATGYNSKFLNSGTIQNKGFEVSLSGTPIRSQDFSWDVNVNWSRNRNKVTQLFEGAENLVLGDFQAGVTLNATLNQAYGTIRGSEYVYTNSQGQSTHADGTPLTKDEGQRTVGANGRYLVSSNANNIIGNVNPDWIGGINNTFRYKNVSLGFLVDTRQGGDLFSLDLFYGMGTGLYPETVGLNDLGNPSRSPISQGGGIILPGVKADGSPNDIRRNNSEGTLGYRQPTGGFVYDGSYVKLREAVVTYSLPSSLLSRIKPVKGVDLSVIGRNLWIIDKNLPYADPEESISSGNLQGYQSGAYPTPRTFTFNVKLKF